MDKRTSSIYETMLESLEQIAMTSENVLQRAEQSYKVAEHALSQLKEHIISRIFSDKQEEINFFKRIKPMFLKELLYHMEVFQVEAWKPPVGRDEQIAHYRLGAHRADLYFKRYNELYTYYRMGSSLHDEQYFLRGGRCDLISPISISDTDSRFSTVYSFQFAKLQAYEQFSDYLHRCVYNLEHPGAPMSEADKERQTIRWTDSKSALIELGYGIYAKGSINYGKADIKQIMTSLEIAFNTSLGNFYRTFQNLRIRKKNRTPYWDSAREDLIKNMDNADLDS
ncbi:RteC domain-containing protein [Mucilaginibacter boryungensis]|uniref:RteC domain-containing protein n=1 Tax=Mucilaginibacter boryungensis TaxID=768480 RepID=A0ABR9XM81_9SPHI|nr:RteC domain-containing protein [Mucilaginibacter boryungensis]MBE9668125.1 RteC domain-containing protein [Mucilaginibacter boryungensis]